MDQPTRAHDCRLLWVAGVARATCRRHWWRTPGVTAAPVSGRPR